MARLRRLGAPATLWRWPKGLATLSRWPKGLATLWRRPKGLARLRRLGAPAWPLAAILASGALDSSPPAEANHARPVSVASTKSAGSSQEDPQALFEAMLAVYAKDRDFRAQFVQTPISRATGEGEPESGVVAFKRPDLWRWEYQTPEKKVVYLNGTEAVLAVAGDPDPTRYELSDRGSGAGEPLGVGAILSGGAGLGKRFVASFENSSDPMEARLRLDPVALSEEYDHVVIRLARKGLRIREVEVEDPGGNSLRFVFTEFRSNLGLEASIFQPPASPKAGR